MTFYPIKQVLFSLEYFEEHRFGPRYIKEMDYLDYWGRPCSSRACAWL